MPLYGVTPAELHLDADATTVTGTAYADAASGLNIPVSAGVGVRFHFFIHWVANATTTGARFSLNGPSITRAWYLTRHNTDAATVATPTGYITGYDSTIPALGTASGASNNMAEVWGLLVPSAAGTLALRSQAEVVSPGSVTVKAGSSVIYW